MNHFGSKNPKKIKKLDDSYLYESIFGDNLSKLWADLPESFIGIILATGWGDFLIELSCAYIHAQEYNIPLCLFLNNPYIYSGSIIPEFFQIQKENILVNQQKIKDPGTRLLGKLLTTAFGGEKRIFLWHSKKIVSLPRNYPKLLISPPKKEFIRSLKFNDRIQQKVQEWLAEKPEMVGLHIRTLHGEKERTLYRYSWKTIKQALNKVSIDPKATYFVCSDNISCKRDVVKYLLNSGAGVKTYSVEHLSEIPMHFGIYSVKDQKTKYFMIEDQLTEMVLLSHVSKLICLSPFGDRFSGFVYYARCHLPESEVTNIILDNSLSGSIFDEEQTSF